MQIDICFSLIYEWDMGIWVVTTLFRMLEKKLDTFVHEFEESRVSDKLRCKFIFCSFFLIFFSTINGYTYFCIYIHIIWLLQIILNAQENCCFERRVIHFIQDILPQSFFCTSNTVSKFSVCWMFLTWLLVCEIV